MVVVRETDHPIGTSRRAQRSAINLRSMRPMLSHLVSSVRWLARGLLVLPLLGAQLATASPEAPAAAEEPAWSGC